MSVIYNRKATKGSSPSQRRRRSERPNSLHPLEPIAAPLEVRRRPGGIIVRLVAAIVVIIVVLVAGFLILSWFG